MCGIHERGAVEFCCIQKIKGANHLVARRAVRLDQDGDVILIGLLKINPVILDRETIAVLLDQHFGFTMAGNDSSDVFLRW